MQISKNAVVTLEYTLTDNEGVMIDKSSGDDAFAFIHGIGGAKYDQLTDLLIQRFFNLEPPVFLTVSATFRLPTPRPKVSTEDLRHIDWLLRDLWYHPERHLDNGSAQVASDRQVAEWDTKKRHSNQIKLAMRPVLF